MIAKRKRNSKSKGLSNSALDQADCPQAPGGPSARPGRTVRGHRANRPRGLGGMSAWLRRTVQKQPRTSSTAPSITDRPRWARGPSAPSRIVRHSSTDRPRTPCNKNPPAKWIERKARKNTRRTRRTVGLKPPRGPSAWSADSSPNPTSRRSTPPSHYPISRINQGIATKS
jgi:hypothetical protein